MKTIQISSNNVIVTAIIMYVKRYGWGYINFKNAETLKKRMKWGELVRFCYQKLNGEIRHEYSPPQSFEVMGGFFIKVHVCYNGKMYIMLYNVINDKIEPSHV